MAGKRSKVVSVRLPADLASKASREAQRLGMTLSEFVRRAALGTLPNPASQVSFGTDTHSVPVTVHYVTPPANETSTASGAITWQITKGSV